MASAGPELRVGLEPSTSEVRWRRASSDIADSVAVVDGPGDDPLVLLEFLRGLPETGLRVVLADDHMAIDFSHGLGDVALSQAIVDVVTADLPVTGTQWRPHRRRVSPLAAASVRTFGSDPRRLVGLLRFHRRRVAATPGASVTPVALRTIDHAAPSARAIRIPDADINALRALRDRNLPGVSMFVIYTCALLRSLDRAGIPVNPDVTLPFDARPYLPKRFATLASFSAGLAFDLDAHTSPVDLQSMVTESAAMGRPVANLLVSTWKSRFARRSMPRAEHLAVPDTPDVSAELLHSFVGRLPRTAHTSFSEPSRAVNFTASDPVSPAGITVTTAVVGANAICMTAAFYDSVFDAGLVQHALESVPEVARELAQGDAEHIWSGKPIQG